MCRKIIYVLLYLFLICFYLVYCSRWDRHQHFHSLNNLENEWKRIIFYTIQVHLNKLEQRSCSQSAVSKHVNRKLSGRKRCRTNRENRSLMRIVKQNRFKNLGELHEEWTEAGVKTSRAPHTDVSRNLATVVFRGVLPGLREEELDCCPAVQSPLFR